MGHLSTYLIRNVLCFGETIERIPLKKKEASAKFSDARIWGQFLNLAILLHVRYRENRLLWNKSCDWFYSVLTRTALRRREADG